jgi:hypothetical protein
MNIASKKIIYWTVSTRIIYCDSTENKMHYIVVSKAASPVICPEPHSSVPLHFIIQD